MKPPVFNIYVDTREQTPLIFPNHATTLTTLTTGDYSAWYIGPDGAVDLRDKVVIERKSVGDLLGCVGQSRDRFEACLERMALIPWRAIVVEGGLEAIAAGTRHSTLTPPQIMGSLTAWATRYGIPVWPAPNRKWAAAIVRTILTHAVRWSLEK